VHSAGASLDDADAALVLIHGRGATAQGMLALADEVAPPEVALRAPQAFRRTWYPHSFLAPTEQNEPFLTSALHTIDQVFQSVEEKGIPRRRIALLGFSQGACLACEYAARQAQRYGAIVGLSGGLIGPEDTEFAYEGSLDGTPVFLGCSDQDPHIPLERVQETGDVFRDLEASVDQRIYPGMGHTANDDELRAVRELLRRLVT